VRIRLAPRPCLWNELSNADDEADEKRTWVRITHSFHPWRGRRFRFVAIKRTWGEERVTLVSREGKARSVPVNWTDAAPPEPYAMLGKGRARVRIEDLLLLVDLIDAGKRDE
jgi:hypothetical protein